MPRRIGPGRPGRAPADRTLIAVARLVVAAMFRLRVEGGLPADGPLIIAANHLSYLDPVVLGALVADAGRLPQFLVTPGAFAVPVTGPVLRRSNVLPAGRGAVEAATRVLDAGGTVVIYPEGHLPVPGQRRRARLGVATIACRTHAPVLPVALWGMQREGRLSWARRRGAAAVLGTPLHCDRGDRADAERVLAAIRTLLPAAQALTTG